jgi:hypothetical protein
MTGIFSILQSSYTASSTNSLFSPGSKFANVDPTKWQGTWTGKDFKNQPFTIRITNVKGFRGPAGSTGLHHHQEQLSDRQFQLCANRCWHGQADHDCDRSKYWHPNREYGHRHPKNLTAAAFD